MIAAELIEYLQTLKPGTEIRTIEARYDGNEVEYNDFEKVEIGYNTELIDYNNKSVLYIGLDD